MKKEKIKMAEHHQPQEEYKLYKMRWVIMLLFMMYTINAAAQWAQFSIIGNLVIKYYNGITPTDVEWTTTCSMLAYVILVFPSLYLLNKVVSLFHDYWKIVYVFGLGLQGRHISLCQVVNNVRTWCFIDDDWWLLF